MAMESGAFTVFLYKMKAREFLWDLIERTTGARMTTSYIRIGGVRADLHEGFAAEARTAVAETRKVLKDVRRLLDRNPIFLGRTKGVAVMSAPGRLVLRLDRTLPSLDRNRLRRPQGPALPRLRPAVLRRAGRGVGRQLRPLPVRMAEMEQSLRLVEQCLGWLERHPGPSAPAGGAGLTPAEAIRAARRRKPDGADRPLPEPGRLREGQAAAGPLCPRPWLRPSGQGGRLYRRWPG